MVITPNTRRPGFTLIELLIAIGIIGVISTVVLVAINPTKMLEDSRNAERLTLIREQEHALTQHTIKAWGSPISGIPTGTGSTSAKSICKAGVMDESCVNLDTLVPDFIVGLPVDTLATGAVVTGYGVYKDTQGRFFVCSDYLPPGEKSCAGEALPDGGEELVACGEHGQVASLLYGDHCYYTFAEEEFWADAEERCEAFGAHLAVLTSTEELAAVGDLVADQWYYYLGSSDIVGLGTPEFRWITGESTTFQDWYHSPAEPNDCCNGEPEVEDAQEDCMTIGIYGGGQMNDFVCTGGRALCEEGDAAITCGNGTLEGTEECDDGNQDNVDGCSGVCTIEPGFACSGTPSTCEGTCGNGIVNGSEACDDGNTDPNDGCSATCTIEACGDGTVNGAEQCDDGNTTSGDGCTDVCVTEVCGDGIVSGTDVCDDGNVADNDGCSSVCAVEACGDGIQQAIEGCDDGNVASNDGCSSSCAAEVCGDALCNYTESTATCYADCGSYCGDGAVNGSEACDDANTNSGDGCSAFCVIEICGDSVCNYTDTTANCPQDCGSLCGDGAQNGSEACDDGNVNSGDGCSSSCVVEYCADGSCNNNETSVTCYQDCGSVCGDGAVNGPEACDDGNVNNGDGCNSSCVTEYCGDSSCNYTDTTANCPQDCGSLCGDSAINGAEACDDSNANDNDGCSSSCAVEAGWNCSGAPSSCSTLCGDGLIRGSEQCDDGSTVDLDGCSSNCIIENGWECSGEPSVCTQL